MAVFDSMLDLVGNTPMLKLKTLNAQLDASIWIKLENRNPLSSVKDRLGKALIEDAERRGILKPGSTIVEATSGNAGIALAWIAALKGYKLIICMPDSMSMERRRLLSAFGAQLELTPGREGMSGALARAQFLADTEPDHFLLGQFDNPANPQIHYKTTAEEIWRDTGGKIDILVAGVGTGGTISGTGRRLKELKPELEIVAVEPDTSAVLSGGPVGMHRIQGIGAGFVPGVLDTKIYSEVLRVGAENAGQIASFLAQKEGLFCCISTGANVWAAQELAKRPENKGKLIATFACDTGERYLSTWLWED